MRVALLRGFFWLIAAAGAALSVREGFTSSPMLAAVTATALGLGAALWSYRKGAPFTALGVLLLGAVVLLIVKASFDMGGARGSAVCFAFIPGFLGMLVLGRLWGTAICALMLCGLAWLDVATPPTERLDRLRFADAVAMTVFATGLAYSFVRTFDAYEAALRERGTVLKRLRDMRHSIALAIYEELEPLAARLVEALAVPDRKALENEAFRSLHTELDDSEFRSARSLGGRIQRLIAVSKEFLLAELPEPVLTPVVVSDVVKLLNEAFGPGLAAKSMRLVASGGGELSMLAQAELLVESVLGNLLSNALKFSPQGASITLYAERSGSAVHLHVCDAGPGLPPDVLGGLDRDGALPSRLGTAGERGQRYGLQLTREHLQRMGGQLKLENRPEGGLDAVVILPLALAAGSPDSDG